MMIARLLALMLVVLIVTGARTDWQPQADVPTNFEDTLVTRVSSPTALAFTPDGRLLITSKSGQLNVYKDNQLLTRPALDLSNIVCTESERGLVGVAVDPQFSANQSIYLYYTAKKGINCDNSAVNRVVRYTLPTQNVIDPATGVVLLDNIHSPGGNHNGGDVQFGNDGYLYVSVGDGGCDYRGDSGCAGDNNAARDRNVLLGKILRITRDGGIPADNPFRGADSARCHLTGITESGKWCQETYAWGLRNPFRIAFDPNSARTRFYINDVGQSGWEEINEGKAGADYGWNVREGQCAFGSTTDCGPAPAGMTNPIYDYGRSEGCVSITGGAFVPGQAGWPPPYRGAYLFSDFGCGRIFLLQRSANGTFVATPFVSNAATVVSMAFGPAGDGQALYYSQLTSGGAVRRVTYSGTFQRVYTPLVNR